MVASSSIFSSAVVLFAAAALLLVAHADAATTNVVEDDKAADLVARTCATMRRYVWSPQLSRNFCESALRSSKRSAAAKHPRELALVAMDLLRSATTAAASKVDVALHRSGGRHSKSKRAELALRYCQVDYDTLALTVPECLAMIVLVQQHKPRIHKLFHG